METAHGYTHTTWEAGKGHWVQLNDTFRKSNIQLDCKEFTNCTSCLQPDDSGINCVISLNRDLNMMIILGYTQPSVTGLWSKAFVLWFINHWYIPCSNSCWNLEPVTNQFDNLSSPRTSNGVLLVCCSFRLVCNFYLCTFLLLYLLFLSF